MRALVVLLLRHLCGGAPGRVPLRRVCTLCEQHLDDPQIALLRCNMKWVGSPQQEPPRLIHTSEAIRLEEPLQGPFALRLLGFLLLLLPVLSHIEGSNALGEPLHYLPALCP